MEPVELRPAFQWTCPECGIDQFESGIVMELTPEEQQEMRDEYHDEFDNGDWMMAPETVECRHCEREFPTVHYRDEDDDVLPGI